MYEGEFCPVCGKEFTAQDDIVVCPVCGAPHHRDCYRGNGKCFFEDKHGTGADYREFIGESEDEDFISRVRDELSQGEQAQSAETVEESATQSHYCKRCGGRLIEESDFCVYCGQRTTDPVVGQPGFSPKSFSRDPLGGESADEDICSVTARELAESVRINAHRYVPRFKKISSRKVKLSWSWSAALFGEYYYFFRKMYFVGIVLMALGFICVQAVNYLVGNPLGAVSEISAGLYKAMQAGNSALVNEIMNRPETLRTALMSFVPLLSRILLNFIFALASNYIYLQACVKRINKSKKLYESNDIFSGLSYHMDIVRRGGVNVLGIFMAYFSSSIITYIMSWLVEMI